MQNGVSVLSTHQEQTPPAAGCAHGLQSFPRRRGTTREPIRFQDRLSRYLRSYGDYKKYTLQDLIQVLGLVPFDFCSGDIRCPSFGRKDEALVNRSKYKAEISWDPGGKLTCEPSTPQRVPSTSWCLIWSTEKIKVTPPLATSPDTRTPEDDAQRRVMPL